MPKSYEQYEPPARAEREDGGVAHAEVKRHSAEVEAYYARKREHERDAQSEQRARAATREEAEAAARTGHRLRTLRSWALGVVVPPLLVFGAIVVFGWGGGWSQLTGQTHPVTAKVVGIHGDGGCGKHDMHAKYRLDLEWGPAGSLRTGHVDVCGSEGEDYRNGTERHIRVWVDHDGNVADDEGPWFLWTMGGIFTAITWGALLWTWFDGRRPKPKASPVPPGATRRSPNSKKKRR